MKGKFYASFLMILGMAVWHENNAQSPTTNYVKVYKAQTPLAGDLSTHTAKEDVSVTIVYYDGLGREIQSISKQGSPLGKDIVSFSKYDDFGKKTVNYLPYVANQTTGAIVSDPLAAQLSFFQNMFGSTDGAKAFAKSILELSELSRPLELGAVGDAWQPEGDRTVTKEYLINGASDVLHFSYDLATNTIRKDDYYDTYSLTCTKTKDEDQNDVLEYVDKEGHTVCKKVKAPGGVYACTYYVYDDFGQLVVVLPPEAIKQIIDGN